MVVKWTQCKRRKKDGSRETIACPEAIVLYRKIMGGVDLADQMAGLYDLDCKSLKWWKKVFYLFLLFAVVNSWVVHKELQRKPKMAFLDFLCDLSESLIAKGQSGNPVKKSSRSGRRSNEWNSWRMWGNTYPQKEKHAEDVQDVHKKDSRREQRLYAKAALFRIAKIASLSVMNKKNAFATVCTQRLLGH